jgi:hypothetical protein
VFTVLTTPDLPMTDRTVLRAQVAPVPAAEVGLLCLVVFLACATTFRLVTASVAGDLT